jgi:antitoxin component of RelBE/YafQ-DinJ toxin-antitoxin module
LQVSINLTLGQLFFQRVAQDAKLPIEINSLRGAFQAAGFLLVQ